MAKHRSSRSHSREAHWRSVLDEWSRSGLTQAAFCRKRAISVYCLRWWKRELPRRRHVTATVKGQRKQASSKQRPEHPSQPAFLPVRIAPASVLLEIVLINGRVIRVPSGCDLEAIGKLASVLEQTPC